MQARGKLSLPPYHQLQAAPEPEQEAQIIHQDVAEHTSTEITTRFLSNGRRFAVHACVSLFVRMY